MNELMRWLYGRSARNAHIREMALKAIEILKKEQSMEHHELCEKLGIGFDKYQKPKRTFYFVINPLKNVKLVQQKRVYADNKKKKYKTHYFLTPERFRGYMDRAIDDFYSNLK
ncbi:MAG: hypothetical protein J7K26_01845 [Candidatus Aenigmarchaeota archaeon]|nr:hypothetical protein [Candidatus Aenigmarchaeota archaeon]